jgi:hypothetical protein
MDGPSESGASFSQVKSVSVKPRLAGRQPSDRGGVPRVRTWSCGRSAWQVRLALSAALSARRICGSPSHEEGPGH